MKELKGLIGFGGSPRASINLALAARSYAFIKRRGYVIPEDVRAVAHDVLRHRIGLTYEAEATNVTSDEIVSKILNKVEVPDALIPVTVADGKESSRRLLFAAGRLHDYK